MIKPCPFCGKSDILWAEDHLVCECGASAHYSDWNKRPLENKLKKFIDILIKSVDHCTNTLTSKNEIKKELRKAKEKAIKEVLQKTE